MTPERIEHLRLLQNVIDRMAGESAAMKRYCLLLVAAALALAGSAQSVWMPVLAALASLVFWALDAQYLRQERWFREMYERARTERIDPFVLMPPEEVRRAVPLSSALRGWSTSGFYLPIALVALLAGLLVGR